MRVFSILLLVILTAGLRVSLGSQYTITKFNDSSNYAYLRRHGQLASYSKSGVSFVSGELFEPQDDLLTHSAINPSMNVPFIVFLPISGYDDYARARAAENIGAAGVVFYSSSATSRLSLHHLPLSVLVTLVIITDEDLKMLKNNLQWTNTDLSVEVKDDDSPHDHHLFAALVLTILGLPILFWLALYASTSGYIERCIDSIFSKHHEKMPINPLDLVTTDEYKTYSDSQFILLIQ